MAFGIIWSKPALQDLNSILQYIRKDSPSNAIRVFEKIEAAVKRLADFPHSGHAVAEINDPRFRENIIFKYRVIFRIKANDVEIIAVAHGARLIGSELLKRFDLAE
jgi:toxin ParE1/3/4